MYTRLADELVVGVEELDEQHKGLRGLVEEISRCAAKGHDAAREALHRFKHAAMEHFTSEEALMSRTGYPTVEEHSLAHADFLKRLGKLERACRAGEGSFSEHVLPFLHRWVDGHFLVDDAHFCAHLRHRAVAA